jgi:hypothetical protein
MDEITIKNRIEAAVETQRAPEKLVNQTILRAQGIAAGRDAERRLEQEGDQLPKEEVAYLTAAGLIGRLAFSRPLPEGSSLHQMTEQLAASPRLQQRLNRPVEETLSRLRSGMLFGEIGAQAPVREAAPAAEPKEVTPPVM